MTGIIFTHSQLQVDLYNFFFHLLTLRFFFLTLRITDSREGRDTNYVLVLTGIKW